MASATHSSRWLPAHDALMIDFDAELFYWRENYRQLPIYDGARLSDVEPIIKLALDACLQRRGRSLDDMRQELQARYSRTRGEGCLDWSQAQEVIAAIWNGFSVTNQRVAAARLIHGDFRHGDATARPQRAAAIHVAAPAEAVDCG